MNIECGQCGSSEISKLSLIFDEGFSRLEARSRGWGLMVGAEGAELGFGKFRTKGQIQSRLSRKVSPPHKWSYWKVLFWGLIGLLVLEFTLGYVDTVLRFGGNFNQQLAWCGYAWLAIIVVILSTTLRHNVWIVPKRLRVWERSFMCHRCGRILELPQPDVLESQAFIREAQP